MPYWYWWSTPLWRMYDVHCTSVDDISEIFEIDSITEIIDSLTNNNKDSDGKQEAGFDPPSSSEKQ